MVRAHLVNSVLELRIVLLTLLDRQIREILTDLFVVGVSQRHPPFHGFLRCNGLFQRGHEASPRRR